MTINLKGGKELSDFLGAFPTRLQKGAVRAGLTAAARPIRDQARANAPRESGKLARAIRTGSPKVQPDGTVTIKVRMKGAHAYIGLFMEYGVAPHFITAGDSQLSARKLTNKLKAQENHGLSSDGQVMKIGGGFVSGAVLHPGFAAKPFLRPALDAKADEAIKAFGDRITSYLKSKTGFTAPAVLEVDEE